MSERPIETRLVPTGGVWWAAYDEGSRHFVVPIVAFNEYGAPYVWSAETHRPVPAVRTSFIGIVSDSYRGEFGELVAKAIKNASNGHRGDASTSESETTAEHPSATDDAKEKLRDGIEKARDAIHDATGPDR